MFKLDTAGDTKLLHHDSLYTTQSARLGLLHENAKPAEDRPTIEALSDEEDSEEDEDYFGLPPPSVDISNIIESTLQKTERRKTKAEQEMDQVDESFAMVLEKAPEKPTTKKFKRVVDLDYSDFNPLTGKFDDDGLAKPDIAEAMESTKMVRNLEQLKEMPNLPERKAKELKKIDRAKTKGAGWYNLPATEMTEEVKNDLKILQMRSVLDPKHFYKKNDLKVLPKYFQIGTVQHSPLDYYSERGTRRNKKKSLVDEILADAEVQKYTKRKFNEIMARKNKYAHRKAMNKMKKLKKKKK